MDKDLFKQTNKNVQDLFELFLLGRAGVAQNTTPLVRTKFIDGDTTTPAASANGSIGLPYKSITAYFAALGNNASVSDANQTAIALISPATAASYTENPTVPAYRNIILRGVSSGLSTESIGTTGSLTWANTAAAGGVNAGTIASLGLANWELIGPGTITYTDDAGAPVTELIISNDQALNPAAVGGITATGGTKLATIAMLNAGVNGNLVSTANGTGAAIAATATTFNGAVTAKTGTFTQCSFTGGGSNVLTFAAGSTPRFIDCNFSGGSIVATATGTITFDGQSWASFKESGGTITSGLVLVVGGSSQGIVMCPPTGAPTSIGDQSVSISLNGQAAGTTNAGGFNGTLGGNYYEAATALTGNRTVTLKIGGGELTGDTVTVCRRGAGISANTLSVTNNGGTETRVIAAAAGGFQTWQFNTVVANDWGFIAGGGAIT